MSIYSNVPHSYLDNFKPSSLETETHGTISYNKQSSKFEMDLATVSPSNAVIVQRCTTGENARICLKLGRREVDHGTSWKCLSVAT
jgi:hypothetical protein